MKKIDIPFGLAVREHRERMGVSQEDFADMVGVHRTYISTIERGKVGVGINVAYQLAQALGISLSRLFRDVERRLEEEGS